MARGYNKVILLGNLARDPELSYTPSGQAVAKFTVAVNRSYTNKEGALVDEVDFIPVVVWGRQAENCSQYLTKGRVVLVEGRLRVRSYETQEGRKRRNFEVVALRVQFIGGPKAGEEISSLRDEEDFPPLEDEEEIPF
ncbi:MAG: single-stranded DNA-binding protein [Synergistetes bacterium]|nr:single-stranded DNA-binding protein [Synergistota bacterium]MCX8127259.1 single-stranded DNA-binding protein [Synergistota bacterium]MDW8191855.1 single-stranded DNA-binding protein [Synergistota bacterium]